MLEWVGGDFDPEAFSVDDVNQRLAPLQRRRPKGSNRVKLRLEKGRRHLYAALPKGHVLRPRSTEIREDSGP
jgi:hypothetical protein